MTSLAPGTTDNPDVPTALRPTPTVAPVEPEGDVQEAAPAAGSSEADVSDVLLRSPRAHAFMWLAFLLGITFGAWRG